MMKTNSILFLAAAVLLSSGCSVSKKNSSNQQLPSLKEVFKNDFSIGTALNVQQIEEKDAQAAILIPNQFNAATPENIMKAVLIHPTWDTYNLDLADKMVAYCNRNNIDVNGHTLIWHSQVPRFVIQDSKRGFLQNILYRSYQNRCGPLRC